MFANGKLLKSLEFWRDKIWTFVDFSLDPAFSTTSTTTTSTTPSDCQDTSSSFICSYYVSNGYCSNSWVNDGCKKSCGLCTSTTTTTTIASTTANDCQDGYPNSCPNWGANGFCTVGFFKENCKKSCDNCGTQVCEDEFSFCTSLASTSCSGWIADKCKKSCNKCWIVWINRWFYVIFYDSIKFSSWLLRKGALFVSFYHNHQVNDQFFW